MWWRGRRSRTIPAGAGEQTRPPRKSTNPCGPSPRVRGAVHRAEPAVTQLGTIPAGAGSRIATNDWSCIGGDHPRGCGEQTETRRFGSSLRGPSPRVRGAGVDRPLPALGVGTIPAGAGSSACTSGCSRTPGDHPRGCGEQHTPVKSPMAVAGPSPRVRGAADPPEHGLHVVGTIPAGAGSSWPTRGSGSRRRDHPRGCGEQGTFVAPTKFLEGPSPRVRGAASSSAVIWTGRGTIPAGAGSRTSSAAATPASQDHPRGCGEQRVLHGSQASTRGPSPRVRGAEHGHDHGQLLAGTIPAGAGSRWQPSPRGRSRRDHPRGCGEQSRPPRRRRQQQGPSPRVRGAGRRSRSWTRKPGTIPAGAGSRLVDLAVHRGGGPVSPTSAESGEWVIQGNPLIRCARQIGPQMTGLPVDITWLLAFTHFRARSLTARVSISP